MGPIGITLFTVSFIVVSVYLGKLYNKINVSREAWFIVMAVMLTITIVNYIYETFFKKK